MANVGRPPIWTDPEAFAKSVEDYFTNEETITWTGLALHLGFCDRTSLNDYMAKPEFFHSVKKSLLRIEHSYEKGMLKAKNPTAYIFALKNFGWTDKQEIDQKTHLTGSMEHRVDYKKLSDDALREIANAEIKPEN